MNEQEKSNNSRYIYIAIGVVAVCAYFLFGLRDNGNGADAVRDELNSTATTQQSITSGITNAENTAGKLESGIANAEQSAIRIESNQQTAGELIADCQRIVREVRARAARETTKP